MLRRWEGCAWPHPPAMSAAHEAGAIEYTGHKVHRPAAHQRQAGRCGRFADWCSYLLRRWQPWTTSSSRAWCTSPTPSEYGTLYTKAELEALSRLSARRTTCRCSWTVPAWATVWPPRAPMSRLPDLARLADVFYIGGTKVGALCGEAVVFPHGAPAHFHDHGEAAGCVCWQRAACWGIQFDVLFTDDLYQTISRNAIATATALKQGLAAKGYPLLPGFAHEPGLHRVVQRAAGGAGGQGQVRLLGEVRRHPHRRAHRHQLGHPDGRGRAACWPCCEGTPAKRRRVSLCRMRIAISGTDMLFFIWIKARAVCSAEGRAMYYGLF